MSNRPTTPKRGSMSLKRKRVDLPALSLEKFASGRQTNYNKKAVLEKKKALDAKRVNKYKKLKGRLEATGRLQPSSALLPNEHSDKEEEAEVLTKPALDDAGMSSIDEPDVMRLACKGPELHGKNLTGKGVKRRRKHRGPSPMNLTAEETHHREASKVEREKAMKVRQKTRGKYLRKTQHGQPIMKFRIDDVLAKLEHDR